MADTATNGHPSATLVGRRIVEVRAMSKSELEAEGWPADEIAPVLVLDSGTVVVPSRDEEGNGPGALFGATVGGQDFHILAPERT